MKAENPHTQRKKKKGGIFILLLLATFQLSWGLDIPSINPHPDFRAEISGPTELCLVLGLATGNFSIVSPSSGEYTWRLEDPSGTSSVVARGGATSVGTVQIPFTVVGSYTLSLEERSSPGATPVVSSINVQVNPGPKVVLKPDYLLCGEDIPTLQALDPSDPDLEDYEFTWARDEEFLNVVFQGTGTAGNELTPTDEGYYFVKIESLDNSSACVSNSATYVGPPVDFQFIQDKTEICEGESVKIELDTPISGKWWYRKQGESEKIDLGNSYAITLGSTQFSDPGVYEVGFIGDDSGSSCPSERITTVRMKEGPKMNTVNVNLPTSCGASDGSFSIEVEKDLISVRLLDENLQPIQDYGPQAAGASIPVTGLDAGVYIIDAANIECAGFFFHALNLPNATDETDIVPFKEVCVLNGVNMGRVEVTFPNGNVTGEYRILSGNTGQSIYGDLNNENFISEDLPGGIYYFDFAETGNECHPLIETFRIERRRDVPFSLPEIIEICDSYDLSLQTGLDLNFELTLPDGSTMTASSGESFTLTESGDYSLLIEPVDLDGDYCPVVEEFTVNKLDYQVSFDYEIIAENCQGDQIWRAVMQNLDPEDAIYRWYDGSGEIVGRSHEFRPTNLGEVYQLTVQPKATAACLIEPLEIPFNQPVLSVPVELTYTEECELFIVDLQVTENQDQVTWIEWSLFLEDGSVEDLGAGDDLYEISDDREGIYEATLYRDKQSGDRCEVARVNITVEASTLTPRPDLEDSYPYCSKGNGIPPIYPGDYETYTWKFLSGDVVVSTDSTFHPTQAGLYELTVLTTEGCIYEEEFRVYDVCDIDYVFPNAMILSDPDRDFRVTVSEGVTDAELFILNPTGELIHHEVATEIPFLTPILTWDGTVDGKHIPQGTYAIVLTLKNPEYGLEEKVTGTLVVLD